MGWQDLPSDLLRLIVWEYLDVIDRIVSMWGVCRRWNHELTKRLESSDPYSCATQRTMDIAAMRLHYTPDVWHKKYGWLFIKADEIKLSATRVRSIGMPSHIARVIAFHFREAYMRALRSHYDKREGALSRERDHLRNTVDTMRNKYNTDYDYTSDDFQDGRQPTGNDVRATNRLRHVLGYRRY